ncbi:hypothetical protein VDGL01_10023 [Verticillium dahliae]
MKDLKMPLRTTLSGRIDPKPLLSISL